MKYITWLIVISILFTSCNDNNSNKNNQKNSQQKNTIDPTKANAKALVAEAKALFAMKNYYEANNKLKEAIAEDANNHEAHYWLGRCYEVIDKYDLAMNSYMRAEELGNEDVSGRLIVYYFFDGQFAKAQKALDKIPENTDISLLSRLELKIEMIRSIFAIKKNNIDQNSIDTSEKKFKQLDLGPLWMEEDPELITLNDYWYALLQKKNNYQKTVSYLENIINGQHKKVAEKAVLDLAQIYIDQKNIDKALDVLKLNLEYFPIDDIKVAIITILLQQEKLSEVDSYTSALLETGSLSSLENTAILLLNSRKIDKALSFAKRILAKHPQSNAANFVVARVYSAKKLYDPAQIHYQKIIVSSDESEIKGYALNASAGIEIANGNIEKAIEYVEEAIKVNPKAINSYVFLARVYIAQQKYQEAIRVYKEAMVVFPDNISIQIQIINIHMQKKEWEVAGNLAEKLLEQEPGNIEASTLLATSWHLRGETDKAQKIYDSIMEKASSNEVGVAANNLASLLADYQQNLSYAEELARKSVQLTRHPSSVDTLAWVFYQQKKYDEAKKLLIQILPMRKESPFVHFHYAKVLLAMGDKEAVTYFEKTLELADENFPHYVEVQKQLKELQKK